MGFSRNPNLVVEQFNQQLTQEFGSGVQYPDDLFSIRESRAVKITVFNYNKGRIDAKEKRSPLFTFYLPMPLETQQSDKLNYETFGGLINRLINSINTGSTDAEITQGIGTDFVLSSAKKVMDVAAIKRELGGIQLNPRTSVFFQNPELKVYSFVYRMAAKNENESNNIQLIIDKLKFYSHPGLLGNGNIFTHPELFQIEFIPDNRFLFKPNPCVLSDITVNYNDQTQGAFFRNGAPTDVTLSLTFQEVEYDTKETLTKKYGTNTIIRDAAGIDPNLDNLND